MLVRGFQKSSGIRSATHSTFKLASTTNLEAHLTPKRFARCLSTPSSAPSMEPPPRLQSDVWDDLNNLNDFYDPNTDWGYPEEEEFMSEEDYRDLIRQLRPESRFPQKAYQNQKNNFSAPKSAPHPSESTLNHIKLGLVALPQNFVTRILTVLKECPRSWLVRDARNLRDALHLRTYEKVTGRRIRRVARQMKLEPSDSDLCTVQNESPVLNYNKHQVLAYVFGCVPGVYASNYRVFSEIRRLYPHFKPRKLLDFGTGPGTVVWAASQVWDSLTRYTLVEPSEPMNSVSKRLLHGFQMQYRQFLHQESGEKFPLVVSSYSFSELSNDESRRAHLLSLWEQLEPNGVLVVVEHGTPIGYKIIRQIRSSLLNMKSLDERELKILAPCTHEHKCPLGPTTWCHFVQRIQLPPSLGLDHRRKADWQNSKFSYLVVSKGDLSSLARKEDHLQVQDGNCGFGRSHPSRLIRQPLKRGQHVIMDLCNPNGLAERKIISKKHGKDIYTDARKSSWGDLFDLQRVKNPSADRKLRNWKDRFTKCTTPQPQEPSLPHNAPTDQLVVQNKSKGIIQ